MQESRFIDKNKGVLVIYTGGTIGSAPRDPDPDSPQVVVPWQLLKKNTPELDQLPFPIVPYSFEIPLDSCNVGPKEWKEMAQVIEDKYNEYEGFVILHGTDTMIYTASALSFMLRNLGKPVIITGAQRSAMVDVRNDATQNFLTALLIANPKYSKIPLIPEVCIFFGGKLLRGNRTVKMDTSGYVAYDSPNLPPLGDIGDRIVINEKIIHHKPDEWFRFDTVKRLNTEVTTIFIYPGIQNSQQIKRQLENADLKAAIILSYGSGNIPTNPDFLKIFTEARESNPKLLLVNVTQCIKGPVELGIYETSEQLLEIGFVAANDITMAAAQCKLMTILGDPDITRKEAEQLFQRNIAGEQSISVFITNFGNQESNSISVPRLADECPARVRIPARQLEGTWNPSRIEKALLRLRGSQIETTDKHISLSIYVNLDMDLDMKPLEKNPSYAGTFKRQPKPEEGAIIFDVSEAIVRFAKPNERISFTLFLETPRSTIRWKDVELAMYIREVGD